MMIICKNQKIEEDQDQGQIGQDMDLKLEESLKIDQDMEDQDLLHLENLMDQYQDHLEVHMGQGQEIDQDHMVNHTDQMEKDLERDQDHMVGHMDPMDQDQ